MTKALIRRNRLQLTEEDGSPVGRPATLKVTSGTLTDNGDGTFSLATGESVSPQTSHTASFTISANGYHDNIGATGTITGTFAATPGLQAVLARVADFEFRVLPASGQQIIWGENRLAVDEYLVINSALGNVTCLVNPAGDVQVTADDGDVQEQTP